MDKLIEVVNKLQDAFAALNIPCPFDLPQIAVVGEQSAGKSSVLEKLVGRDFLPRGSGIVTRRPLILQLIYHAGQEYGVFLHQQSKKYTNFEEIRREIELETERVTGKNKNISPLPINLRIYSPNVVNLTLIDLPGVTNIAVGDQPADIGQQIREMILHFITNPNSLILAVIPAVSDIANSEALKLALEVDPTRTRTIGVVTKIDMMGEATDCLDILTNKVYPLNRGFVGVVNRSQKDINSRKDLASAMDCETAFFRSHPVYMKLGDRAGTQYLQRTLNHQLTEHIGHTLPKLRETIRHQLEKIKATMDENPAIYLDSPTESNPHKILILLIQDMVKFVDTQLGYDLENVDIQNFSCGSEISWILLSRYFLEVEKIRPLPEELKREIRVAISNTHGIRRSIFSAGSAFLAVIKPHIQFIQTPCMIVLDAVDQQFRSMITGAVQRIFKPYPEVMRLIDSYLKDKLIVFYNDAKNFIKLMVKIQVDHINTNHPDFLAAQNPNNEVDPHQRVRTYISGSDSLIFREGSLFILNVANIKSNKECYCMLKGQTLHVYKDSMKKDFKELFVLTECKIKDISTKNKFQLVIVSKTERNIAKSGKALEVGCTNSTQLEAWKAAFVSCGIELDRSDELSPNSQVNDIDSELNKDIEYVYLLVDSYLQITIKSMQDLISKIIVNSIILTMKKTLFSDLVVHVFGIPNIKDFMQESEEIKAQRSYIVSMSKSCQEALDVIQSFQRKHGHYSTAPPIVSKVVTEKPRHKSPPYESNKAESDSNLNRPPLYHIPSKSNSEASFRNNSSLKQIDVNPKTAKPLPAIPEIRKPKRPPPRGGGSKFYDKSD